MDGWLEPDVLLARDGVGTIGRSAYFEVPADGTRVGLFVTAKGDAKTVVTAVHEGLGGPDDVAARRLVWRARLDRLAASFATHGAAALGRPGK